MKLASKFATLAFGLSAFSGAHAAGVDDMIASAKENLYGGVSFSMTDIAGTSPTAIGAHVGAKLHPNLAAEARFGIGIGDDAGVEVDNYFSVLAKGILPIQDGLSVYGLAGFSRVAVSGSWEDEYCTPGLDPIPPFFPGVPATCTTTSVSWSETDTGLSLGAGAEFALTPKVSLSAEYLMMTSDVDVMSIAASYKF
jgi:opacity protein-like surface antigen